jgi:uncharacterized membrane protein YhdT
MLTSFNGGTKAKPIRIHQMCHMQEAASKLALWLTLILGILVLAAWVIVLTVITNDAKYASYPRTFCDRC